MDCKLTPEICTAINETANSLFYKIGLWWFLGILLVGIILYFAIERTLSKRLKKYETDLEKTKTKDIEIWKQQKELMFDFVKFLEERFFNNPELKKANDTDEEKMRLNKVKSEMFAELNTYYGQLYLVMETDILNTINKYLEKTVSPVQRFYLYKELRKQLMSIIHEKFNDDDCPFIDGDPTQVLYFAENGSEAITDNFEQVKITYPFVENTKDGKYKTLPFFAENKRNNDIS